MSISPKRPVPFTSLRVDGQLLDATGIRRMADDLVTHHGNDNWALDLRDAIHQLIDDDTTLHARTSGTTGPPKVVDLDHRDLVSSARLTAATFNLRPGDRALHCLPCAFIAGKMMLVRGMVIGLDLHIIDPRGSVLENLDTSDRFAFSAMVPQQLHRAIQEDRPRVERQFDTILIGGGPVSMTLIEDLRSLRTRVAHTYGSTETLTPVAFRESNAVTGPAEVFSAIGATHFGTDERECLIVHTPHLLVKEHVTNDLVELVDPHHFRWLGRADNVILKGGRKIFPEQLEARTAGVLPYPHFFTAMPDDRLGQAVMLVIETDRSAEEVLPEVLDKVTSVLKRHEWPRRVTGVSTLDRNSSGELIRPTMRSQHPGGRSTVGTSDSTWPTITCGYRTRWWAGFGIPSHPAHGNPPPWPCSRS